MKKIIIILIILIVLIPITTGITVTVTNDGMVYRAAILVKSD